MEETDINTISRIYIIGDITNPSSFTTRLNFYKHQLLLESYGYIVINPLEAINDMNFKTSFECSKYNLKKLIECNAVYVMSDVSLKKGDNIELKISIDLNLFMLQSLISNPDIDDEVFQQVIESFPKI